MLEKLDDDEEEEEEERGEEETEDAPSCRAKRSSDSRSLSAALVRTRSPVLCRLRLTKIKLQ